MNKSFARIVPALVHIQAHLDQDLSLELLADEVGLSKFHFHKLFHEVTGETPKAYVDRLRLERAAMQLLIRRGTVLEIALECGYRSHATFSRAFRAHFAMAPREYRRQWARGASDAGRDVASDAAGERGRRDEGGRRRLRSAGSVHRVRSRRTPHQTQDPRLSPTRIVRLARMPVAFIRHLGPYERVAASSFERLSQWARRRGGGGESPLLLGIAHDAPGITPPEKIRFDCCVRVPEPFEAEGEIACQRTPGGEHAITDYVGSWNLAPAYAAVLERLQANSAVEVIGLPAIEVYQTTRVGERDGLAHVMLGIPVKPVRPSLQ